MQVPPDYAAMVPFDPLVGEFRVHYAIARSWIWLCRRRRAGRTRGVGSALARGAFHPRARPDRRPAGLRENAVAARCHVRPRVGSNYQAQGLKLSKHSGPEHQDSRCISSAPAHAAPATRIRPGIRRNANGRPPPLSAGENDLADRIGREPGKNRSGVNGADLAGCNQRRDRDGGPMRVDEPGHGRRYDRPVSPKCSRSAAEASRIADSVSANSQRGREAECVYQLRIRHVPLAQGKDREDCAPSAVAATPAKTSGMASARRVAVLVAASQDVDDGGDHRESAAPQRRR